MSEQENTDYQNHVNTKVINLEFSEMEYKNFMATASLIGTGPKELAKELCNEYSKRILHGTDCEKEINGN